MEGCHNKSVGAMVAPSGTWNLVHHEFSGHQPGGFLMEGELQAAGGLTRIALAHFLPKDVGLGERWARVPKGLISQHPVLGRLSLGVQLELPEKVSRYVVALRLGHIGRAGHAEGIEDPLEDELLVDFHQLLFSESVQRLVLRAARARRSARAACLTQVHGPGGAVPLQVPLYGICGQQQQEESSRRCPQVQDPRCS